MTIDHGFSERRRHPALAAVLALLMPALAAAQPAAQPAAPPAAASTPAIDYTDPVKLMEGMGILTGPLFICSIVSLTICLERFVRLRRKRVVPAALVDQLLEGVSQGKLDRESALRLCRADGSPMAEIFRAAVRHWGRPTLEIEQAVSEAGAQQIALLKRNLRALQGSANIATLLGLLGTILGMIQAFNEVASSQALGRAELLATGIGQALLTTAAGLVIAIPSLIFFNYFADRVERLVSDMDQLATDLIDEISAETIAAITERKKMHRAFQTIK